MFVLVVEDDRDVRELLRFTFERAGFGVLLELDSDGPPDRDDLVGIVSGLPSGARLQRARGRYRLLPIIEVAKPFSPRELVLRVRSHVLP
jgi:DNA-binding response OmpR family regulator